MDEKTNAAKQIPTVKLGGRIWELRFGHKAMKRYCGLVRCNMETFDRTLVFYENQIRLLWCMISCQDDKVTEDQLDDWLDEVLLEDILNAVGDAVTAAMPKTYAKLEEQADKAAPADEDEGENPTGTTSAQA